MQGRIYSFPGSDNFVWKEVKPGPRYKRYKLPARHDASGRIYSVITLLARWAEALERRAEALEHSPCFVQA